MNLEIVNHSEYTIINTAPAHLIFLGGSGRLFEFEFEGKGGGEEVGLFGMGAYSRWALRRCWALIPIKTVYDLGKHQS